MMADEELIAALRSNPLWPTGASESLTTLAADRLEALAAPAPAEMEVVAWLVDCFVEPVVEFYNPGDFSIPLVRLTDAQAHIAALTAKVEELTRLRDNIEAASKGWWEQSGRWQSRAEAAEARNAELVKALEPFSTAADDLDDGHPDHAPIWEVPCAMSIDAGHLRRARAALGGQSNEA